MLKEGSCDGREGGGLRAGCWWAKAGSILVLERGWLELGRDLDVGSILSGWVNVDDAF